ncbi:MAG: DNA-formamidopyrimidine glycosylase [Chloroflexota bacterium]|nr:MAG: DNA-formamidopyrimidine glycosylase [Chloroflexota bacterium]
MPELPEVETTVRDLRPHLIGRTIQRARVTWERTVAQPNAKQFMRAIVGYKIIGINRRGKYLVFELERPQTTDHRRRTTDDGRNLRESAAAYQITNQKHVPNEREGSQIKNHKFLLVHLRMTGQFGFHEPRVKRDKHQHVHLLLDDGRELRFHDFRKFGRWWLVDNPAQVVGKLGPEPLEMSKREFLKRLRARRGHIKPLLLNQTFVAGVGNIYADESLWYAKIHPLRDATTLTDKEASDLYNAIRRVFRKAIGVGGTSFDATYKRINGQSGEFQEDLRVVGRAGEPCHRCGTPIVKTVVGQRGTYYCPMCQRV